MPTVVITGANRGLGLEFAAQYSADGWRTMACCREPEKAQALSRLAQGSRGRLTVHPLEVTNPDHVNAFCESLGAGGIDVLINNAGIYGQKGVSFGNTDANIWKHTFHTNVIAPFQLMEKLHANLLAGEHRVVANVTSKMGSISDNTSGGSYGYRSSKAALNAAMRAAALDLAGEGFKLVLLHPGWVKTDMGGGQALIDAETSVSRMRAIIAGLEARDNGRFINQDGTTIPW